MITIQQTDLECLDYNLYFSIPEDFLVKKFISRELSTYIEIRLQIYSYDFGFDSDSISEMWSHIYNNIS